MRAAVCDELPSPRLEVREVADPVAGDGELVLEVEACGICGTDLHILSGESYRPSTFPFVLGHEPVGIVRSVGRGVSESWLGQRVTVTLFTGCGVCELCLTGDERLCPDLLDITGVKDSWGGYADLMVVRERQAVPVPHALGSEGAATLVDAGATAMNAARVAGELEPGSVVVVGGGPVGFLTTELVRRAAAVTVVEPVEVRRSALVALGYETVATIGDVDTRPDVIVECAGVPVIVPWALERLAPRGGLVLAGYCSVPDVDFGLVSRKELTIRGVRSGSRRDLAGALELAAAGKLRLPAVTTWGLDEINEALDALRDGELEGKAVIVP